MSLHSHKVLRFACSNEGLYNVMYGKYSQYVPAAGLLTMGTDWKVLLHNTYETLRLRHYIYRPCTKAKAVETTCYLMLVIVQVGALRGKDF